MARARFGFQVVYDFLYTRCICVWFLEISVKSCFIGDINWICQTRSDLCKIFITFVGDILSPVICWPLSIKKRGYSDFILFLQMIPLRVSHVFLMSFLYLVNSLTWYSFLAARIHWFRYLWYIFKLCLYTSYSGLSTGHSLSLLYRLSRNSMDLSIPVVIQFDSLCWYLLNLTRFF